ncbi:hypothetical protein J3B00_001011 [Pseudomonas sp. BP8]|nr:hypothetical protein [Pseudomonas sp. BP8]
MYAWELGEGRHRRVQPTIAPGLSLPGPLRSPFATQSRSHRIVAGHRLALYL